MTIAEKALELAASFLPHTALLDIGMPGCNGYELAQRIRVQSWGRELNLIALTGWRQDEDKRKAFRAGFDHHLTKPVDPQELTILLTADIPLEARQQETRIQ